MGESVVDFFSSTAEEFASAYQNDPDFRDRFALWKSVLDDASRGAKTAFDMGCGPGLYSFYLASKGLRVTGIDAAEGMIRLCESKKVPNCSFVKSSLPTLPAGLGKADLIVSSSLLEYMPDLKATLAVFREHLQAGGRLVFSLPNGKSFYRQLERTRFQLTGKPEYYQFVKNVLSEEECVSLLAEMGFRCERIAYYAHANLVSRIGRVFLPENRTENLFLGVFRKN